MNEPPYVFPKDTDALPAFWEWTSNKKKLRYFGSKIFTSGTLRADNSIVWEPNDIMDIHAIADVRQISLVRVRQLCTAKKIIAFKGSHNYGNLRPWIVYAGDALVPKAMTLNANRVRTRSEESKLKTSRSMKRVLGSKS